MARGKTFADGPRRPADKSSLAGVGQAREPGRERVWGTKPEQIQKTEDRIWEQPVGGTPAAQLGADAGTPGRRVAVRIDGSVPRFPGDPPPVAAGKAARR